VRKNSSFRRPALELKPGLDDLRGRNGAGMNPINRVGQKVVCVQFCCDLPGWPLLDETYTVIGFAEIEYHPGIFLLELPSVSCSCHQLSGAPWPIEVFRRFDQRTTDISELTKILDQRRAQPPCPLSGGKQKTYAKRRETGKE
jgi:hypothetical protein